MHREDIPMKEIEDYVRERTTNVESMIHDFWHLKQVAVGAKWFVAVLNGSQKEQQLAYVAGLLHDIVRPSTELKDHAKESAEEAKQVLHKFGVDAKDMERICEAIESHRAKHEWKTPLHQSVFLADKIFEQMGACIVFRRSMWVAECKDYAVFEDIEKQFERKIAKFTPKEFPIKFENLVNVQFEWPVNFLSAFKSKEPWAISIARHSYENGKTHIKTVEKMIESYRPISESDKKYKQEALKYLRGEKFKEFETLVKL